MYQRGFYSFFSSLSLLFSFFLENVGPPAVSLSDSIPLTPSQTTPVWTKLPPSRHKHRNVMAAAVKCSLVFLFSKLSCHFLYSFFIHSVKTCLFTCLQQPQRLSFISDKDKHRCKKIPSIYILIFHICFSRLAPAVHIFPLSPLPIMT